MFCNVEIGSIRLVLRDKEKETPDRMKKGRKKKGVKGGIKGREKERQEERNNRKLGLNFTLVLVSYTLIFKELMK
jgi:hypothetical protein